MIVREALLDGLSDFFHIRTAFRLFYKSLNGENLPTGTPVFTDAIELT